MNALQSLLQECDHLETPSFATLKPSILQPGKLGVFANTKLPANHFVGHYKGKMRRIMPMNANMDYLWTILSARNSPIYYIDATVPRDGNFTRYVRWRPVRSETNVISLQQGLKIAYFTSRDIDPGEELVIYVETDSQTMEQMANTRKRKFEPLDDINLSLTSMKIFLEANDDDWNNSLNGEKFNLIISPRFLTRSLSGRRMLMCELCSVNFYTNVSLRRHFHSSHINERYLDYDDDEIEITCPMCSSEYELDIKLAMSTIIDETDICSNVRFFHLFKCCICSTHYNTYDALKIHMNISHPERLTLNKNASKNAKQKRTFTCRLVLANDGSDVDTTKMCRRTENTSSSSPPSVKDECDEDSNGTSTTTDAAQSTTDVTASAAVTANSGNEKHHTKSRVCSVFDVEEENFIMSASLRVAQNCKYFLDGTQDDIKAVNDALTPYLTQERSTLTNLDVAMLAFMSVSDELCEMDTATLQHIANIRYNSSILNEQNTFSCYYCKKSCVSNSSLLDHEIVCANKFTADIKTNEKRVSSSEPIRLLWDSYAEKFGTCKISCIPPLEPLIPLEYPDGKSLRSRPQRLLMDSRNLEEAIKNTDVSSSIHNHNSLLVNGSGAQRRRGHMSRRPSPLFVRGRKAPLLLKDAPKLQQHPSSIPKKHKYKTKQKFTEDYCNNDFTCPHCLIPFDNLESLDAHADSGFCFGLPTYNPERGIYFCPICGSSHDNGKFIYDHIVNVHYKLVSCS